MKELKGIIFDFDGTILDSEMPIYRAWLKVYRDHGFELDIKAYSKCIGSDMAEFSPFRDLEEKVGKKLDWDHINIGRRAHFRALLENKGAMPGIQSLVEESTKAGLKLAIASSSSKSWIAERLPQTGLDNHFHAWTNVDDVERPKPDPALFQLALQRLDLRADETIVIEDSPNGLRAARKAGIFCVTIPNELTQHMEFDTPDLMVHDLKQTNLEQLTLHWRAKTS